MKKNIKLHKNAIIIVKSNDPNSSTFRIIKRRQGDKKIVIINQVRARKVMSKALELLTKKHTENISLR